MTDIQPILDVAVPQIAAILVSVVGSVVLGLWGRTQIWARKRLGVEMDALDRETLDAAIMTGIRLVAARSQHLSEALGKSEMVALVMDHVMDGGAPDAVSRLRAPNLAVRRKIEVALDAIKVAT